MNFQCIYQDLTARTRRSLFRRELPIDALYGARNAINVVVTRQEVGVATQFYEHCGIGNGDEAVYVNQTL